MKKSGFLTFIFSLFPGAGQMYQGFLKRGTSLMTAFWGLIAVAALLRFDFLLFLLPIIWCYAFFDALNLHSMPDEQRANITDDFLFQSGQFFQKDWNGLLRRRHLLLGILLIVVGTVSLYNLIVLPILNFYDWYGPLYSLFYDLPTLVISIAIIGFGLYLIKGGKRPAPPKDFVEFKGEEEDRHE